MTLKKRSLTNQQKQHIRQLVEASFADFDRGDYCSLEEVTQEFATYGWTSHKNTPRPVKTDQSRGTDLNQHSRKRQVQPHEN